jgi:hypothetical protein
MRHGHPKTDRAAVILHVQRVVVETECLCELADDLCVVIKRVREGLGVRPVAMAEARIVRCDKVILIGQSCEERLEHARRRRQTVQQEQRRCLFRTRFPIKDCVPIDTSRSKLGAMFHARLLCCHARHRLTREHLDNAQHSVRGRARHAGTSTLNSNFTATRSWHSDLLNVHDITLAHSHLSDESIGNTFVPVREWDDGHNTLEELS